MKWIELILLFIILPLGMVMSIPLWVKLGTGFIGFVYVIVLLIHNPNITLRSVFTIHVNRAFWYRLGLLFTVTVAFSAWYVLHHDPLLFFSIPLTRPWFWLLMVFVYTVFSVIPQEIVYRTFFFDRYRELFAQPHHLLLTNAALFSLCHLMFGSALVMVFTFVGGVFFAFTYQDSHSTMLVSIEHALYGSWFFSVGMGALLAFPG